MIKYFNTLREEILAGRNFGRFGGLTKNSPKFAKISSRQNQNFLRTAKINSGQI